MRTLSEIKSDMVQDILDLREDVKLVEGDTQHDVTIVAPANQFYRNEVLLEFEDRTRNLTTFTNLVNDETFKQTYAEALGTKQDGTAYTIDDVNTLISERLNAYIQDWGFVRNTGVQASGSVRVYLYDTTAVSWDASTEFSTSTGVTYSASTTFSNIVPNYDTVLGLYYIDIPILATDVGVNGNATVGSIRGMTPKPSNFSYVTNVTSITGGSDAETDLDLINRASEAWATRVAGNQPYIVSLAESKTYVDDVKTIVEDDTTNDIYVGSVCDVMTQFNADDVAVVEEYFYWPGQSGNTGAESFYFTPTNQPILSSFTPILYKYLYGSTDAVQITTNSTTIVEFVKDTGTFSESVKANDQLKVQMVLNIGTGGSQYQRKLKLIYAYDRNPSKLQNEIEASDQRLIGPDPLVRKATNIPLDVVVVPTIAYGYVTATVQAAITSNIGIFFNGGTTSYGKQYARKGIGESINHSEIADVITRTEGVVSYDTDIFFVKNSITGSLEDPTVIKNNQYASLNSVSFTFSTYNIVLNS